jgi:hypothetical protein
MSIPDTFIQVAIFVLFVVPGVMFATVRTALIGYRSPDFSVAARILEGLFVSVIFDAVYVLIFYNLVIGVATAHSPLSALGTVSLGQAFVAAILLFIVPVVASGWISGVRFRKAKGPDGKSRRQWTSGSNYRPIPTGWDHKGLDMPCQLVRVRVESGVYYGGWYGEKSLMSTYPQPRDIFIQSQWEMTSNGDFVGKIAGGGGIWLSITDKCVVDWLNSPE